MWQFNGAPILELHTFTFPFPRNGFHLFQRKAFVFGPLASWETSVGHTFWEVVFCVACCMFNVVSQATLQPRALTV